MEGGSRVKSGRICGSIYSMFVIVDCEKVQWKLWKADDQNAFPHCVLDFTVVIVSVILAGKHLLKWTCYVAIAWETRVTHNISVNLCFWIYYFLSLSFYKVRKVDCIFVLWLWCCLTHKEWYMASEVSAVELRKMEFWRPRDLKTLKVLFLWLKLNLEEPFKQF